MEKLLKTLVILLLIISLTNIASAYTHSKYRNDWNYIQWKEDLHRYGGYGYHYPSWHDTSHHYYYHYSPTYDTYTKKGCYYNPPRWKVFYTPCPD